MSPEDFNYQNNNFNFDFPNDAPDDYFDIEDGAREIPEVPFGAEGPYLPPPPEVEIVSILERQTNKKVSKDTRVKIIVPPRYRSIFTIGTPSRNQLGKIGGIIFPYTPSISYEAKADYSDQKPLHTNYAISFYQRSYITDISITGDFTVENEEDAEVYLATTHLLKSLTKMRFGTDFDAGAAPPVCRLYAYGEMVLHNAPISITSFRIELPKDVDYYYLEDSKIHESTSVPTKSVIAINCKLMYSRQELQLFGADDYVRGEFRKKGLV